MGGDAPRLRQASARMHQVFDCLSAASEATIDSMQDRIVSNLLQLAELLLRLHGPEVEPGQTALDVFDDGEVMMALEKLLGRVSTVH